jgi:hypothetical protein
VAWFRIPFAENAFLRLLGEHGLSLDTLSVENGIAMMTAFYQQHRPQHTADGDDRLELKWLGRELLITRWMTRSDDAVSRALVLTFRLDRPRGVTVVERRLELL